MQQKNAVLTAILAVVLIALISAGATLAYLTDRDQTDTVTYTITEDVKLVIALDEPIWKAGNQQQPGFFDSQGRAIFSAERKLIKDPEIYVEEGSVDCYVRLYVRIEEELANVIETPFPHERWIRERIHSDSGKGYQEYYYYYPVIMKAGQRTPRAFEYIEFRNPRDSGKTAEAFFTEASDQSIIIKGQAFQAEGFEAWDKVPWVEWENT